MQSKRCFNLYRLFCGTLGAIMEYTKTTNELGNEIITLVLEDKTLSIPADTANSDYQRYLAWLENPEAEQSTPNLPN
jgi:hypothetical protein